MTWCRRFLPFAEFDLNKLNRSLNYKDEQFDFIYAVSVFTHLDQSLQLFWMEELRRVLRPGGFLLFTTHGTMRTETLTPQEMKQFESAQFVVRHAAKAGQNECAVF